MDLQTGHPCSIKDLGTETAPTGPHSRDGVFKRISPEACARFEPPTKLCEPRKGCSKERQGTSTGDEQEQKRSGPGPIRVGPPGR